MGNSQTAVRDLETLTDIRMMVTVMAESVAARLYEQGLKGQVVSLSVRNRDLQWWSKQRKISRPTNISQEIIESAMDLFKHYDFHCPVRSVGVNLSMLSPANDVLQLNFLDDSFNRVRSENLEKTVYNLRLKYGNKVIRRAILSLDKDLTDIDPKVENTIHPHSYF